MSSWVIIILMTSFSNYQGIGRKTSNLHYTSHCTHTHTHTGNELRPIKAFARHNVILTFDVIYICLNATTIFIYFMSGRIHHRLCLWSAGWVTGHGKVPQEPRVVACGSASLNCDGVVTYQWHWPTDRICQMAGCKNITQQATGLDA